MKQTARGIALDALLCMDKNEGYSNLVIDQALRASGLDRRNSALASAIFYGALEKRLTLDYFLKKYLRDPGRKLEKTVSAALRCGAYQILYLDRVPDSAAVNETVNELKRRGKAAYAGFVNGVLRSLIRGKGSFSLPEGDTPAALSIRYSVPDNLILLWRKAYGEEAAKKLLEAFSEKPGLYIRANSLRTSVEELGGSLEERGVFLTALPFPKGCAQLENCGFPAALSEFQEGLFHVQDLSAQIVCELVSPLPGEVVYDCCAAPGGKTFTLAEKMEGAGVVRAFDLYPGRVKLIEDGARRLGISNIAAQTLDMTDLPAGLPKGHRVLCDVPCSGFGVIRRKPEIRYKDLSALKELPELQFSILQNASQLVMPGGRLVYSTCTLNPAENGEVAERFLRENPGFKPLAIDTGDGAFALKRTVAEPAHHWTMMPFAGVSDGFFAAVFQRMG